MRTFCLSHLPAAKRGRRRAALADMPLLVALPKSSSDSAAASIASMGNLSWTQERFRGMCIVHWDSASKRLYGSLHHADMCNVHPLRIKAWQSNEKTLYKQHLPPTKAAVQAALANGSKTIVLLRNPWFAAESDCETARAGGMWLHQTKESHLAHKLLAYRAFARGWRDAAAEYPEQIQLIEFDALQASNSSREAAFSLALRFWGMPRVRPFRDFHHHYMHCGHASCYHDMRNDSELAATQAQLEAAGDGEWSHWAGGSDEMAGGAVRGLRGANKCAISHKLGSLDEYEAALRKREAAKRAPPSDAASNDPTAAVQP